MSKIIFDYSKINPIIVDLQSIINDLNTISSRIDGFDKPYFSQTNYINNLSSSIRTDSNSIDSIINNVKNQNVVFEQCLKEKNDDAKRLPNYILKKRESIIKKG